MNFLSHFWQLTSKNKSVIVVAREQNVSLLSKLNKMSSSCTLMDEVPRLPIPINKMNCSVARTSLARLLR